MLFFEVIKTILVCIFMITFFTHAIHYNFVLFSNCMKHVFILIYVYMYILTQISKKPHVCANNISVYHTKVFTK